MKSIHWLMAIVLLTVTACRKKPYGEGLPVVTAEIVSFAPTHGAPGTVVTIAGKNFHSRPEENKVQIGGAGAAVITATATELTVKVPQAAVTGKIKVNAATSATDFTVEAESAAITDFAPKQGGFGTEVVITGRLFTGKPVVKLNGVEAEVKQWSASQVVITIPANTTLSSHKISLHFDAVVLETGTPFTVTQPGPLADWVSRNVNLGTAGIFHGGLGFAYRNKLYWGFTRMSVLQNEAACLVFDPAAAKQEWVMRPPPPAEMAPAVMQHATAVVLNDNVYIGTGLAPAASNKWWRYDPLANTAAPLAAYPENTSGALSFVLNNIVYAGFGGVGKNLYKFNEAGGGSWQLAATGTFRELTGGSALVIGNEVYLGRALLAPNGERKAMYKFTPPDQLVQVADMPDEIVMQSTPSFTINGKGYFVVDKRVWEYTPGATGGSWRMVVGTPDGPGIRHVGVINNVVFGWTGTGALYEFRFR
jgi:hypothetical protein